MPHDASLSKVPTHLMPTESAPPLPPITLSGGLDQEELDALLPGQLYALTPVFLPTRLPLWVNLLRAAVAAGRVCHVLLKTEPAEFLARLEASGWSQAHDAWMDEHLRLYRMADTFSKILSHLDVEGLTTELGHWGVGKQHVLLVDAADELLSLHDLSLATPQAVKLKAWAQGVQVSVLLNFNLAANPAVKTGLSGLMDHFSGVARLRTEAEGVVLILEYWQSPTGSVAERGLALALVPEGYQLRDSYPSVRKIQRDTETRTPALAHTSTALQHPDCLTVDRVWAQELQLLMGVPWQVAPSLKELDAWTDGAASVVILLRFGPDSNLAEIARTAHGLRKSLGTKLRLVVAESNASLRYANELMLLRLGVDAIIKPNVPIQRWPALLVNGRISLNTPRPVPDIDVESALASATSPHARGYLQQPDFLAEVHTALERGQVLGVPFALAVFVPATHMGAVAAAKAAEFRRQGDIFTTDGEKLYAFFYACSITQGPAVLESVFRGHLFDFVSSVEWMVSDADIQRVLGRLQSAYDKQPMDFMAAAPQASAPAASLTTSENEADLSSPVLTRMKVRGYPSETVNEPVPAAHNIAPPTVSTSAPPTKRRGLSAALIETKRQASVQTAITAQPVQAIGITPVTSPLPQVSIAEPLSLPEPASLPITASVPPAELSVVPEPTKPAFEPASSLEPTPTSAAVSSLAPSTADDIGGDASKKVRAYRVREVSPFTRPEFELSGLTPPDSESTQENATSAAPPEVAGLFRRLAQAPMGGVKKPSEAKSASLMPPQKHRNKH
jgi:cellulose biosynthesis protein BcsE